MSSLTFAFVALIAGGLCGAVGSFFTYSTEGIGGRISISILLALGVLSLSNGTGVGAFVALMGLTFFTGWLSAEWIIDSLEDGPFEERSIATAIKVVVVPPALAGLAWLVIGIFARIFLLIETPVEITVAVHPALKQWTLRMVFAVWGSVIGAFPNVFFYVYSETMRRRRGR